MPLQFVSIGPMLVGEVVPPSYVGPGDLTIASTAHAWWGLRAYSSTYCSGGTGLCCRISDSLGGNETDIYLSTTGDIQLTGAHGLNDVISGYGANVPARVKTLYDQTGNSRHLTQTTNASRPTINTGPLPVMTFLASGNRVLSISSQTIAQPFVLSVAAKNNNTGLSYGELLGAYSSPNSPSIYFDTTNINFYAGGDTRVAISQIRNSFHMLMYDLGSRYVLNGTQRVASFSTYAFSSAILAMGTDDATESLSGDVVEASVYTGTGLIYTISKIDENLRSYWSISGDSSGLSTHWPMNDGTGTTMDDAQNVVDATLSSSSLWVGNYVVFDGTEYGITNSGSPTAPDLGTGGIVFCWVNGASQTAGRDILARWDVTNNAMQWRMIAASTNTAFSVTLSDDGTTTKKLYRGSQTCFDSTWHSICFRWDAGTLDLFVDGVKDPSVTKTTDTALTQHRVFYSATTRMGFACSTNGAGISGNPQYVGAMNKVRIYNVPKSDAEILALHNLGH